MTLITGFGRLASTIGSPLLTAFRAPLQARQHPRAVEVRSLLQDGWVVREVAISVEPSRAVVTLVRDGATRVVADNDLGFTAYAAWLQASSASGAV